MGLQSSIFHRKDHAQALAAVGVIVDAIDFPATVRCPCCGEIALNIYEDIIKTDLWLACTHCPAHGNIITFAASYWKIDALAAITKFKELGVNTRDLSNDTLTATLKYARWDAANERFWEQAKSQLWTHSDDLLSLKFRDFGLSPEIPCEGLAGIATTDQIAELCKTVFPSYPRRLKSKVPVLVLPYCDLPRHYCGFLLIQYAEEFEARRVFLPTYFPIAGHGPGTEAGYYFLEQAVLAKNSAVNNAVFVVDDPQWVLKAQTIQLRHGAGFLPICASYAGKDILSIGGSWGDITRSRRFFYSSRITPELVTQAANGRGYICALQLDGLPKPKQPAKTIKTLSRLYKSAVTWQKTLIHVFEQMSDIAAHSFTAKLLIPAEKLRNFFALNAVVAPDTAEQLLAKIAPIYFSSTETTQYSTNVMCRDDGWYTAKNSLITNCIPVIEKIVHTDDSKYYVGHIKKQNTHITFQDTAKQIETMGLLAYAERLMAARGEHVMFVPGWNRRAHITAMTLRPPEIVHVRSQPGWDETTKEFYCGKYAINVDGLVRALPVEVIPRAIQFNLPEPGEFAPATVHTLLTPSPDNALTWVVVAAAIANMIAPACDQSQQSIAIAADAFINAREILQAIGCRTIEIKTTAQQLNKLFAHHVSGVNWPKIIIASNATDRYTNLTLIKHPNTAAIIRVLPGSIPTALSYGWPIIDAPQIQTGRDYSAIAHVVASYIQHAVKNRAKFNRIRAENLITSTLRNLHVWLAENYNSTFNLPQAENYLYLPGNETIHLMREINNAILADEIDILPAPRKQRQNCNYIVRDKDTWWLNRRTIDAYLYRISGLTPNWIALADGFAKAGVLRGEKTIHKINGFLVEREWCDQFWTNYSDATKRNIG